MADYIYLLQNRLSQPQQNALNRIREIARERGLTVFLVGGAVRDLTSGSPVRDLDVVVQGNALKLKKDIEKAGGVVVGEHDAGQALFVTFPGGAKVEIGSTLSVTYPKPGKPVLKPASILEDLRRRDFTANAMAISLNTGSYGLLMDPLNGVADIENRELRLVSNYGFIEDPIRMVRAVRLMARLGWQMDEKTQARYATGKEEGYISAASAFQRGYETEEIVHEEDPLRVMRGLEAEGWLEVLAPQWSSAKVNVAELERLRESQTQLQMQGIHPNPAAANFPLLTARLSPKEVADLKASFARPGFVREIGVLEAEAKDFAAQLSAKSAALPSQSWKLIYSAKPEAVLHVAYSSKSAAIQAKLKSFYSEWPLAKQKIPYLLLQEMRITPELAGYDAFVESLMFELMDGKLESVEEMKAFLEPFSPPAPPPPVHLRRPRAAKKEAKASKGRVKKAPAESNTDSTPVVAEDSMADGLGAAAVPQQKPAKVPAGKATEPVMETKAAKVDLPKASVSMAVAGKKTTPVSTAAAKKPTAVGPPVKLPVVKGRVVTARKPEPAKKQAVKSNAKSSAKKSGVSKAGVSKSVAHKSGAQKVVANKPVSNKTVANKTVANKTVANKTVANKTVAKKTVAKGVVAKKGSSGSGSKKAPVKNVAKKVATKTPIKGSLKETVAKAPTKSVKKMAAKSPAKKRR